VARRARPDARARRAGLERFGDRGWQALRSYFLGVTTVAVIDALLIGLDLVVLGVPLVLSLAVLTFFAAYFPVIGAFAAGVVAVLVAFVTGGTTDAAIVAVLVVLVQQLEGNVLYPIVMRRRVRLHPLTTILAVAVGGTLAGVLGAFIAVPIAAMVSTAAADDTATTDDAAAVDDTADRGRRSDDGRRGGRGRAVLTPVAQRSRSIDSKGGGPCSLESGTGSTPPRLAFERFAITRKPTVKTRTMSTTVPMMSAAPAPPSGASCVFDVPWASVTSATRGMPRVYPESGRPCRARPGCGA